MKTTIEIGDSLISEARLVARNQETTLRDLVESGLRKELVDRSKSTAEQGRYKLPDRRQKGSGIRAGVDLRDWREIREIIYAPRIESK